MNANNTESIKVWEGIVNRIRQHIATTGQTITFFASSTLERELDKVEKKKAKSSSKTK